MMTVLLYTENQDLSSAKEVFFINSGKKIARVIGLTVASLLGVIFLLMVISAAAFGSAGTVGVFGFNLFICDSAAITTATPAGSARYLHFLRTLRPRGRKPGTLHHRPRG